MVLLVNKQSKFPLNSRIKIIIRGAVQGVGFRPFIYKLASGFHLTGFVSNSCFGVLIEAEGSKEILNEFIIRIEQDKPDLAQICGMEFNFLDAVGYQNFEIRESENTSVKTAFIMPDIAVCNDCLKEMFNPTNRRYLYPFINCINCGPRFSIIESLPYDRNNTSMKKFVMCGDCYEEYMNPSDRRFHAQPIACKNCGPHVELWNIHGEKIYEKEKAISKSCELIRDGKIVTLKGLGGYQLIVDARNDEAVRKLRFRKQREEKPFAVMFPSISMIQELVEVSILEKRLLLSSESPIILLKKKIEIDNILLCDSIAPDNPYLGVMLPYTPLHHLIMRKLNFPIVATSGNIAEEPMCINEVEALIKLGTIADYFLVHNRTIARHVDDSIVRIFNDRQMVLRRARGYAPFPVQIKSGTDRSKSDIVKIAVGGHFKNTVALNKDENIFISQHIGDLSTSSAYDSFSESVKDLSSIYDCTAELIIHDSHPEYLSTKYALGQNVQTISVQHHLAHVASCKAENQVAGKVLGISWDGTGYGLDGNIWGSEFFLLDDNKFSHVGQFRNFTLPGGDKSAKESRRALLGILYEMYGDEIFTKWKEIIGNRFNEKEIIILKQVLEKDFNTHRTSSAGRLFDAVSSLLGISQISKYEGQSAMKLEFVADKNESAEYSFRILGENIFICDWQPIIEGIMEDIAAGENNSKMSAKYHNTLARVIQNLCELIGEEKVLLSGGCFQNIFLLSRTINLLNSSGFRVYTHQKVPTNDGGISLGQIAACHLEYESFDIVQYKEKKIFIEV